jgi:hypothetical protein
VQQFIPSNLNLNTQGLAVLGDGTLIGSFVDFQRPRPIGGSPRDGLLERPRTWAFAIDTVTAAVGVPQLISETCSSGSYMAVDPTSGPRHDRLYSVCADLVGMKIDVRYSADRGERWSIPHSIDTSAAQRGSRSQPQIAVNKDGIVGISWLDGRDDPTGHCYALFFAASLDGGDTFLPPARVSRKLSCPDSAQNGSAFLRWPRGGDYHGLAATADGRFHALWSDASTPVFQVMTATIDVQVRRE